MKLEQQVCSLEFAQKLRDLDVEQYGLWTWCDIDGEWSVAWSQSDEPIKASRIATAFTVAELGEMLPDELRTGTSVYLFTVRTLKKVVSYEGTRTLVIFEGAALLLRRLEP